MALEGADVVDTTWEVWRAGVGLIRASQVRQESESLLHGTGLQAQAWPGLRTFPWTRWAHVEERSSPDPP